MIYTDEHNDVSVYLFRQPSSLNGKLYDHLENMTRGKKILDNESGMLKGTKL
jgi:hypothetical protein